MITKVKRKSCSSYVVFQCTNVLVKYRYCTNLLLSVSSNSTTLNANLTTLLKTIINAILILVPNAILTINNN